MFVIRSPRGTWLLDEGLYDDRFATWSFKRGKARIVSQDEYDAMARVWPFLRTCELLPALQGVTAVAA